MSGDHDLGYTFNNKLYAQILDSLDIILKKHSVTTLSVALPGSNNFGNVTFSNSISVNGIIYRSHILERCLFKLRLNTLFGKNIVVSTWKRILSKTNAKLIIAIQPTPELCIAATELNICICDYQHGIISNENYYGSSYRQKFNNTGWPNYILCWNTNSKKWVEENILPNSIPILVGNPWYLLFKNNLYQNYLKINYDIKKYIRNINNPTILVSLQWGLESVSENNEIGINNALFQLISNKDLSINWLIRIHPISLNSKLYVSKMKTIFSKIENVEWEETSKAPLPLVLKNTDLHITSHSAVTIEAEWYNIKTALINSNHSLLYDYFEKQINKGIANIVEPSYESILLWINNTYHKNFENISTDINTDLIENFIINKTKKNINEQ